MLTYNMEDRGDAKLYEYLYACIRHDIESCRLKPGQRLPSKRAFAEHLGVSVITVEAAYAQLVAEGYAHARPRSGYFVSHLAHTAEGLIGVQLQQRPSSVTTWLASQEAERSAAAPLIADFSGARPSTGAFPYEGWARTVREVLSSETEESLLAESAPMGSPRLRRVLADYLRQERGMDVAPEQVVVGAGAQTLYNLIVQLVGRDRTYAVEDPGYVRLTKVYHANGAHHVHVPLDAEGVKISALAASGADVVHVMPSHQFPTGLVTSVARRYELLGWASRQPGRLIIEDDYDCEFRMAGRPIPALQSIDTQGSVIYINTFSKSLGAAFRVGYLVLPPALAARYEAELGFYSCTVSTVEQLALARFIERGDYERHVHKQRAACRTTRAQLLAALAEVDAARQLLRAEQTEAGLHFLLGVRRPLDDAQGCAESEESFARAAAQRGLVLAPLSSYCLTREVRSWFGGGVFSPAYRWFVMNDAGLDADTIPQVAQVFADLLAVQ